MFLSLIKTYNLEGNCSLELWQSAIDLRKETNFDTIKLIRPVEPVAYKLRKKFGYTKRYCRDMLAPSPRRYIYESNVGHTYYKNLPSEFNCYYMACREVNIIHNGGLAPTINQTSINWFDYKGGLNPRTDAFDILSHPDIYTYCISGDREVIIRRAVNNAVVLRFDTKANDLFVMRGSDFQKIYTHEIGKRGDERITITFRSVKDEGGSTQRERSVDNCFCMCDVCRVSKLYPIMQGKHYACANYCEPPARKCGCHCNKCLEEFCNKCVGKCFLSYKTDDVVLTHNQETWEVIINKQFFSLFKWCVYFMEMIGCEDRSNRNLFAHDFCSKYIKGVNYPLTRNVRRNSIYTSVYSLNLMLLENRINDYKMGFLLEKRSYPEEEEERNNSKKSKLDTIDEVIEEVIVISKAS